jgi:chromosome segregation ATPase
MEELDGDRIELLERRLADQVKERVRLDLFGWYAAVGITAITIFGILGVNVVLSIKSEIKSEIKQEFEQELQVKRDEVKELISETRFRAKEAKDIIEQVQHQLGAFQPQVESLNTNIQKVKMLDDRTQQLDRISRELDITSQKDLQPLVSSVESLQSQLRELAIQVDKLNTIVTVSVQKSGGESAQAAQQRKAAIQSVISTTKKAEQSLAEKRERTTVFFQFAGGKRQQAEDLSAALKKANYIVPGEDREGEAAGKHEVRYFHNQDRVAAESLAQDATRALRNLGYSINQVPNVEAKSLVSYGGKKPSQGTVELWLEIPPR